MVGSARLPDLGSPFEAESAMPLSLSLEASPPPLPVTDAVLSRILAWYPPPQTRLSALYGDTPDGPFEVGGVAFGDALMLAASRRGVERGS